jgi:hypothetical protein
MRFACWITKATDIIRICTCYLLLYQENNGYANTPQGYVTRTLPLLFMESSTTQLQIYNANAARKIC